jgi:hypothetical protein
MDAMIQDCARIAVPDRGKCPKASTTILAALNGKGQKIKGIPRAAWRR